MPTTVEKNTNNIRTNFIPYSISPDAKTENAFFDLQRDSVIKDLAFNRVSIDPSREQKMVVLPDKEEVWTEENKGSLNRFAEDIEVKSERIADSVSLRTEFKNIINKPLKTNKKKLETEVLEIDEKKEHLLHVYLGLYEPGKSPIGHGSLRYLFDNENGQYYIKLTAEASGWAKLFMQQPIVYESRGVINSSGLSPEYYRVDSPKRGKAFATVSYEKQTIYFSSTKKTETFSERIFDPLSLIFNTAIQANKGVIFDKSNDLLFSVFNRRKIELIKLQSLSPESMMLPNGHFILATKIMCQTEREIRNNGGGISFWLDTNHAFHPVRITFENKKKQRTLDFLLSTSNK